MSRREALDWAARCRREREAVRDRLATGSVGLADVLASADTDELVAPIRLLWVLESLPGARKVDTRRRLAALGLDGSTALGELSPADRRRLLAAFAPDAPPAGLDDASVVVVSGPGGVGKGTIVERLLGDDDRLWLSRSWTTRERRPGEPHDAYRFATRDEFEQRIADGGFLEWVEFLDYLQGSPVPEPPPGMDVLFEIDVQGAARIKELYPDALLVFVDAPDRETQRARLRGRGDDEARIAQRLEKADEEAARAADLGMVRLVNDDLDHAVASLRELIREHRSRRRPPT